MTDAVRLVGVPMDLGAGRRGTDMGPSAMRVAGICDRIADLGYVVHDAGEIDVGQAELARDDDTQMHYHSTIAAVCDLLAATVAAAVRADELPVVMGGDHSLAMGSVSGVAAALAPEQPLGLIYLDAHGDMNTPDTSPSGNVHGMPLAALLGLGSARLTQIGGINPAVAAERTVLLGVRELDAREREIVRDSRVTAITTDQIDRHGMASMVDLAIETATRGDARIHVSLDLDALDPSIAPGVGTPVPGGLTYREAHLFMEAMADSMRLVGLDVVELNPTLDHENATAELAVGLIASALGRRIL